MPSCTASHSFPTRFSPQPPSPRHTCQHAPWARCLQRTRRQVSGFQTRTPDRAPAGTQHPHPLAQHHRQADAAGPRVRVFREVRGRDDTRMHYNATQVMSMSDMHDSTCVLHHVSLAGTHSPHRTTSVVLRQPQQTAPAPPPVHWPPWSPAQPCVHQQRCQHAVLAATPPCCLCRLRCCC